MVPAEGRQASKRRTGSGALKLLSRFMLYRLFSALVVLVVAVCLWQCHWEDHPSSYGWPAFWYSAQYASPTLEGQRFRIEPGPYRSYVLTGRPLQLRERDPVYFLSHAVGLGSIGFALFATWRLLTHWIPRLVRRRRFSLKMMLAATTLTAVSVALLPVRPWDDDLKRAKARQPEGGTVYAGLDPTSTWSPWQRRVPVVFGVAASLLMLGEGAAWMGFLLTRSIPGLGPPPPVDSPPNQSPPD